LEKASVNPETNARHLEALSSIKTALINATSEAEVEICLVPLQERLTEKYIGNDLFFWVEAYKNELQETKWTNDHTALEKGKLDWRELLDTLREAELAEPAAGGAGRAVDKAASVALKFSNVTSTTEKMTTVEHFNNLTFDDSFYVTLCELILHILKHVIK
jgi:hypothetical protein